ncbi:NUDIX hydrolase [Mycetocola zhadangensis]|uniref:NUDIX hydrolase n=1 Tax=Mycetocola zhadangensis TaxID=1164595 RepID=UPI0019A31B2D|nr:NUDIX domain-containing protein [Mycetocola zhadangensis]GGE89331.1 NUDIX hydrolase [Mycetocola zhadangensis]
MPTRRDVNPLALLADLERRLDLWQPATPAQARLRDDYLEYLTATGPAALDRNASRSHLTASCFVFTEDLSAVLLCFHKKGRFWVQLGGHIEAADGTVSAAAFREATEEAGIVVTPLSPEPIDVDRHSLHAGFSKCDVHWDVGFVAIADPALPTITSDESDDVRWWPVGALPTEVPDGFPGRVARVVAAASAVS